MRIALLLGRMWITALIFASLSSLGSVAHADDPDLHEGMSSSVGVTTQNRVQFGARADVMVLPGSFLGTKLNGSRLDAVVGLGPQFGTVNLDQGRVQLLRWAHRKALGIDRDRMAGNFLGLELVGVRLRIPSSGMRESELGGSFALGWGSVRVG